MVHEFASRQLIRCSLCGVEKASEKFHRRGTGRQRWCKDCRRGYDSAYHARTRPIRLEQKREAKQARMAWLFNLKSDPCADCGGTFLPAAMGFDHLPGTLKISDVSTLVVTGRTRMAIAEIAKCDLVCANCHAIRTYIRRLGVEPTRGSIREPAAVYGMSAAPLN